MILVFHLENLNSDRFMTNNFKYEPLNISERDSLWSCYLNE